MSEEEIVSITEHTSSLCILWRSTQPKLPSRNGMVSLRTPLLNGTLMGRMYLGKRMHLNSPDQLSIPQTIKLPNHLSIPKALNGPSPLALHQHLIQTKADLCHTEEEVGPLPAQPPVMRGHKKDDACEDCNHQWHKGGGEGATTPAEPPVTRGRPWTRQVPNLLDQSIPKMIPEYGSLVNAVLMGKDIYIDHLPRLFIPSHTLHASRTPMNVEVLMA
ncbi:hypothetical protein JB92DRAFT_2836030 [Gautieria morchelliformis]|nr:hypothetical protein JB92DRAFT_2836030 [Gautieria morchelliformis]